MARLSFGFSLGAVCISIGSFVAVQLQSNPAPWEPSALNHFGYVLVVLSVALALAVGRRGSARAWQVQIATAGAAVGFVIVALVKLYGSRLSGLAFTQALQWGGEGVAIGLAALAFGLVGPRVRASAAKLAFGAAVVVAVGSAGYALSMESDFRAEVWYFVAGTAAFLAASAAARVHTDPAS